MPLLLLLEIIWMPKLMLLPMSPPRKLTLPLMQRLLRQNTNQPPRCLDSLPRHSAQRAEAREPQTRSPHNGLRVLRLQKERAIQPNTPSWNALPVRRRLADAVERYDKIFGDEPVVDPVKVAHFEALIDELTARGIRVVLVRYPLMPGFDRLVHKRGARQATEAVVDRIRAERDLPLLDYRDVFADQPELFALYHNTYWRAASCIGNNLCTNKHAKQWKKIQKNCMHHSGN